MPELFNDRKAALTVRDYGCSVCWGSLRQMPAENRKWTVICARYGTDHAGYVTKHYIKTRIGESYGELLDVRGVLQDAGVIENEHADKTPDELLGELGF